MRFAYADPPYLGVAKRHYGEHHADAAEYDDPTAHRALVDRMVDEFPDGWALSLSSPSLQTILPMCPPDVRVAAWVKPFCSFKPGVNPAYAWEPVIFRGGRKRTRQDLTVRDFVAANIALKKGLPGAKPPEFCHWIFALLGMEPGDDLEDIFPGTGIVGDCWQQYQRRMDLPLRATETAPGASQMDEMSIRS